MLNCTRALPVAVILAISAGSASASLLNPATNYNLFVLGNLNGSFTSQGPVFVGNDLALSGSTANLTTLASDRMNLDITSDGLASVHPTGSTAFSFGALTFTGSSHSTNFFNITAQQLEAASGISINIPTGADAIINVTGGNAITLPSVGFNFNSAHTLWNLDDFTSITNSSFSGSVLAPYANVTFNSGAFTGTLIANSVTGSGQFDFSPFTSNYPFNNSVVSGSFASPLIASPQLAIPEPASLTTLALGSILLLKRRR